MAKFLVIDSLVFINALCSWEGCTICLKYLVVLCYNTMHYSNRFHLLLSCPLYHVYLTLPFPQKNPRERSGTPSLGVWWKEADNDGNSWQPNKILACNNSSDNNNDNFNINNRNNNYNDIDNKCKNSNDIKNINKQR